MLSTPDLDSDLDSNSDSILSKDGQGVKHMPLFRLPYVKASKCGLSRVPCLMSIALFSPENCHFCGRNKMYEKQDLTL